MDFDLSEEKLILRDTVRSFAAREIAPQVRENDESETFPEEIFRRLSELDLLGVFVPEQYGGGGGDNLDWVVVMEEIARVDPSICISILGHCHALRTLLVAGTEEQKQSFLVPAASGKVMAAFALTEPGAGSDSAALVSSAKRDGDHWVLDGRKSFITNADGVAKVIVVAARSAPPGTDRRDGVSLFVLDADTPGFSFGRKEEKLGTRSSPTGDLVFESCRIPADGLVGEEGKGFAAIQKVFALERNGNSAISIGAAQGALDHAVAYSRERHAFGRPIGKHQGIRWMLADMAAQVEAARLMVYRAAVEADRGRDSTYHVAMAKIVANEMCTSVISDSMQIHGAYGYTRDFPVEKLMRDARMLPLGGGTTQIMREIVGRRLFDS
jgi:alkylation response protein AidB-like acyl-CoA dehydrogenase